MNVDFYVIEGANRIEALNELCLQLETPYAAALPVYIYVTSANEAEELDKLLWTYRNDSFLAHQRADETNDAKAPIVIGQTAPIEPYHVLVNLSRNIPAFYRQFENVIEIVFDDAATQQAARDRFRQYREQGCQLNTHKLKVKNA